MTQPSKRANRFAAAIWGLLGLVMIALALNDDYVAWMELRWWESIGQHLGGFAMIVAGALHWSDRG